MGGCSSSTAAVKNAPEARAGAEVTVASEALLSEGTVTISSHDPSDNALLPTPPSSSTRKRDRIAAAAEEAVGAAAEVVDVMVESAPVVAAATIGTAGMVYDAVRFEESTTGALCLEAGAALLEAFEHVPFVAPAAFLIGAVARASMEAVVLREDARSYAEVAKRVERAMLKARSMESQKEAVEAIVSVLEESLTLVKTLASRGIVASVVRACKDAKKLAEYKEDLVDAVGLLQLECQLELNEMKRIELGQARELESRIDEMGGLEECAACKEKTAALTSLMKKSDALVVAKMDSLAETTRKSVNEVSSNVNRLSLIQSSARESADAHFAKLQLEAEKAATRNAVLEKQVAALANTLVDVKDMLKACPVPTNEPSRLMAVRASGAVGMTTKAEAYPEVHRCALDIWRLLGGEVCVGVNFVGEDATHFPVIFLPLEEGEDLSKVPENKSIKDPEQFTTARKANVCQHVVHRAETVEFVGMDGAPPQLTPAEFQIVSRFDPVVAGKMEQNANDGISCSREHGCPYLAMWWDLQVNARNDVWYRGQPIFCDGVAIGSFCCVGPNGKPDYFEDRVRMLVESNVERIGRAMEGQAETRRECHLSRTKAMEDRGQQGRLAADPALGRAEFGMAALPPAGQSLPPVPVMGDEVMGALSGLNAVGGACDLVNFIY